MTLLKPPGLILQFPNNTTSNVQVLTQVVETPVETGLNLHQTAGRGLPVIGDPGVREVIITVNPTIESLLPNKYQPHSSGFNVHRHRAIQAGVWSPVTTMP
jgi:hypothetical protein